VRHDEHGNRLFFASDIHGSEICWKKFLAAAAYYEAGILVLGGDMTGKALVPIVKMRNGRWRAVLLQQKYELESEAEIKSIETAISSRGYYPFRTDEDAMESYSSNSGSIDALFKKTVLEVITRWMEFADKKLQGTAIQCFVCPGNDDAFEIDPIISASKRVVDAEGKAIILDNGFTLASTGWSNPTPWKTHREMNEDQLYMRISTTIPAGTDCSRWIFNLHAPPHGTGLDDAPELDEELNVMNAGQSMVSVGSTSVRRIIEERKPLLSLHGHIHEAKGMARIGKTLCINPGSLYEQGVLQGALLELDSRKGIRSFALTTG
jgi:Icc-related predicted phosphoesterase